MPPELIQVPLTIEVDIDTNDDLHAAICRAVRQAAQYRGFGRGSIGVLITDDETIHEINARHLSHDYPTDVISFGYTQADDL